MFANDPTGAQVRDERCGYLVCLAGEVPWREVRHRVDDLVARHGGTVMTILETLPGFGVRATDEQALAYAADPAVGVVEQSRRVT